jgi:DNA-binding NtrC family response regulator
LRILLAEDEVLVSMIVAETLEDSGFEVTAVENAAAALARLDQQSFDVIITDIRMPGSMNGWDVAEAARKHHPTIPVIYMTGDSQREMAGRAVPGSHLLSKPFAIDRLGELVNQVKLSTQRFYIRLRSSADAYVVGTASSVQTALRQGYEKAVDIFPSERSTCAVEVLDPAMQLVFGLPVRVLEHRMIGSTGS